MPVVGSGDYRYEAVSSWPSMPRYWDFSAVLGAAVNSADEVHLLTMSSHPLTIWSADGDFISSWGEGSFSANPHGIHIGPDDNVWVVDRDYHIAVEHTPDGRRIRTLGDKLLPSTTSTGEPFNMPSGLAITPNGEIFVSDGYGGHRVHRFSAEGELMLSWGAAGAGPGEFALLHNVWVDSRGRVFICDRMNDRIQIFDGHGNFLEQWTDLEAPCGVCVHDDIVYVAEQGLRSGVSIWTADGTLITRWGVNEEQSMGGRSTAHGICVDSFGSIYVCCVRGSPCVRKFQRI